MFQKPQMRGANEVRPEPYRVYGEGSTDVRNNADEGIWGILDNFVD